MSAMTHHGSLLALRLASSRREVRAAQALRYRVFVEELSGMGGMLTDHRERLERDAFDDHCHHLLLLDRMQDDALVGTMRVLTEEGASRTGGFASEAEFDLSPLRRSGRRLLEIGRTCLHPDHRGGAAMHQLWRGLAGLVEQLGAEILFGLASLSRNDPASLRQVLACLQRDHLARPEMRPISLAPMPQEPLPSGRIDRRGAMLATPSLVKAYLRLGGKVGEGAFLDDRFGCVDVCMVLDTARLSEQGKVLYAGQFR